MSNREVRRLKRKVDNLADALEVIIRHDLELLRALERSNIGTPEFDPRILESMSHQREGGRAGWIRELEGLLREI